MKPIALQLYTLREEASQDFAGTLKKVADMGYKGVEPAGFPGLTPQEAWRMIDDLGMAVTSCSGAATVDGLDEAFDAAAALHTDTLICGFGTDDFASLDAIERTAETINRMAEKVIAAGLRLAMHNHYWEFGIVDGKLAYDLLMERCPTLRSELDIFWAANFGACDPAEQVAKYRDRAVLLHIKDGPLAKPASIEDFAMTAAGQGEIDIPAAVGAADPDVLQWLIVELDVCKTDMVEAVADSYAYLTAAGLAEGNK